MHATKRKNLVLWEKMIAELLILLLLLLSS